MNEYPRLISFRMDWLDLLAVWGTLKNLLQHQSSKASILRCSAFFIVQLSQSHMTTGKTIALTRRTFVDKVMYLLFNMLSGLVITFLPRSKGLLISWLQSPSTVILEPRKIKSATVFFFFFFLWQKQVYWRKRSGPSQERHRYQNDEVQGFSRQGFCIFNLVGMDWQFWLTIGSYIIISSIAYVFP